MSKHARTVPLLFAVALAGVVVLGCEPPPQTPPPAPLPPVAGLLATVNGAPITEADVLAELRNAPGQEGEETPARRQAVLETLIQQELASQRAVALGLENDHDYQQGLSRRQAEVRAFQRKKLSELLYYKEIAKRIVVDDHEARAYFDEYTSRIRSEIHVWQILTRDEASIDQARDELAQGRTFEEVVRERFPNLPATVDEPWDLGYLHWEQVADVWWTALAGLRPGEITDIIRGPNHRFWILKLIDRRDAPDVTYEKVKSKIMEILQDRKRRQLREQLRRELRAGAQIVYAPPAAGSEPE